MSVIRPDFGKTPEPPKAEDTRNIVWVCAKCECTTYFIRPDYVIECAECGQDINQTGEFVGWKHRPPAVPAVTEEIDTERTVIDFADSASGMDRMKRHLDPDTTAIVIHVANDGAVHSWGSVDGEKQREWFERRIVTAREMLFKPLETPED